MKRVDHYRKRVREIADFFGWKTCEVEGSLDLLSKLIKGVPSKDIVMVNPGEPVSEEIFLD